VTGETLIANGVDGYLYTGSWDSSTTPTTITWQKLTTDTGENVLAGNFKGQNESIINFNDETRSLEVVRYDYSSATWKKLANYRSIPTTSQGVSFIGSSNRDDSVWAREGTADNKTEIARYGTDGSRTVVYTCPGFYSNQERFKKGYIRMVTTVSQHYQPLMPKYAGCWCQPTNYFSRWRREIRDWLF